MRGLYIHIPFCVRKCAYCDFVSFGGHENYIDAYLDALLEEAKGHGDTKIDTVFIGGGTPSVLNARQLDRLFNIIHSNFNLDSGTEFSMEVNPATASANKIQAMLRGGVNRVSIGVQSFNDCELKAIGRIHTAEEAKDTILAFHNAGFNNINIDLMLSLPLQTPASMLNTLREAVSLPIRHISAYSLILEEGTPLYNAYRHGEFTPADEDVDRDMFETARAFLEDNGFLRYEISNFAKQGYECRHNIKYWQCDEYIGLGLAAHSYLNKKRFYNTSDLKQYLNGNFHSDEVILLSPADIMSEFMIMGLRMTKGVSKKEFKLRFTKDIEAVYGNVLEKFINLGCIRKTAYGYSLTSRGMDVSNSILCEFI